MIRLYILLGGLIYISFIVIVAVFIVPKLPSSKGNGMLGGSF